MMALSLFINEISICANGTGGVFYFYKMVPCILKMLPFLFRDLVTTSDDLTEKDRGQTWQISEWHLLTTTTTDYDYD